MIQITLISIIYMDASFDDSILNDFMNLHDFQIHTHWAFVTNGDKIWLNGYEQLKSQLKRTQTVEIIVIWCVRWFSPFWI